jgi:hypothetical protein
LYGCAQSRGCGAGRKWCEVVGAPPLEGAARHAQMWKPSASPLVEGAKQWRGEDGDDGHAEFFFFLLYEGEAAEGLRWAAATLSLEAWTLVRWWIRRRGQG